MTSLTGLSGGGDGSTTQLTRRLSLLPTALGIVSVAALLAAGRAAGITGQSTAGSGLVWVAAVAVGVTVVIGHPVGLYVGLVLFVIAALLEAPFTVLELIVVAVGLLLVHEISRPSLDARYPAWFGRRIWTEQVVRTLVLAATLVGAVVLADWARDLSWPRWLVPVGLAVAAIPLVTRRAVAGPGDDDPFDHIGLRWAWVRFGLGLAIVGAAVTAAVVGAAARSEIVSTRLPVPRDGGPSVTTTTAPPPFGANAGAVERSLAFLAFLVTMLIVGVLVVALRRREQAYDLDELDLDDDDATLALGGPGQADLEDTQVEIDERELARLLDELAVDLGAEPDPGRAIRFAYANIERRLARSEVVRAESETEQEFLDRALPSLGAQGQAMVELTELFERARFGHGTISEQMRGRALDAVERLRAATAPEPEPAPESESKREESG